MKLPPPRNEELVAPLAKRYISLLVLKTVGTCKVNQTLSFCVLSTKDTKWQKDLQMKPSHTNWKRDPIVPFSQSKTRVTRDSHYIRGHA